MIKVVVDSVELSPDNGGYMAFLQEENGGRFFPIRLERLQGANLLFAIKYSQELPEIGNDFVRKLTNLGNLQIEKVVINDLLDDNFHAEIFVKKSYILFYVLQKSKCYPSVALSLAVHTNAPIFVVGEAMKKGRTELPDTGDAELFDETGLLYQEEDLYIRLATENDAEFIQKLFLDVLQMHADNIPEVYKSSSNSSFSISHVTNLIADPTNYFLIGYKYYEEPIGYVHVQDRYFSETLSRHSVRYLYIYNIAVKPEYQHKGCGRRLLQAVKRLAIVEGIDTTELTVWSFNEKAREFFITQGFTPLNETMRMTISSQNWLD